VYIRGEEERERERKRERIGARCTIKNIRDIPTRRLIGIEENRVLIPAEQEISRGGGVAAAEGEGEETTIARRASAGRRREKKKKKEKRKKGGGEREKSRVTNKHDVRYLRRINPRYILIR
jgi:hypothetical protein